MSNVCPLCPYKACPNSKGAVRSDGLRRHVQAMHKTPPLQYVDPAGSTIELISPTLIIKKKSNGQYGNGYCLACGCYVCFAFRYSSEQRLANVKHHICKPKQVRGPRKPSTQPKPVTAAPVAAGAPVASVSFLDLLKKDERLAALRFGEWEEQQRNRIEEQNENAELNEEEPEVYDEWDSVIVPKLKGLMIAAAKSDKLSTACKELRHEIDAKEDEKDMLKREIAAEKEEMQARLNEMARQLSEERMLLHAAQARLKQELEVAPAPGPDKIQHQGGSDVSQWSLPYQG